MKDNPGDRNYVKGEAPKETRRMGVNVGDFNNPRSADTVGFAVAIDQPAIRVILYRGDHPLGHISLTLEGMEDLGVDLYEAIAACKEQHKVKDQRN